MQHYTLSQLNSMTQEAFTAALGEIWEETPEIACRAWNEIPFSDVDALHQSMVRIVEEMSDSEQLALIKAHPDLGSKAKMADASVREQAGAGLDRLDAQEYERFQELNQAYKNKFGMPFIIAVKEHTKASILAAFEARLRNAIAPEKQQALQEISKIARFRLEAAIHSPR
ncbi:MAG: 2-oxo-4-hydroxy-4-carboxy-5-ureidoimidazoline decarboxylase [Cyanophyceae cyanobacterium]